MAAMTAEADSVRVKTDAPAQNDAASDNLRPHSFPPSAAEVNLGNANAQAAAQDTINKQFGALTLTNPDVNALCGILDKAPKDAHSMLPKDKDGGQAGFIWQDGHGYAQYNDGKGHTNVCVEYKNGTKVGMSGETVDKPAPGGIPLKPNSVEVLSNGGKMQFENGPDGKTVLHATDPHRNTQDFPVNGDMTKAGVEAIRHPNYQVHWGESGPNGLAFFPTSDQDSPARKAQYQAWQARHPQEIK